MSRLSYLSHEKRILSEEQRENIGKRLTEGRKRARQERIQRLNVDKDSGDDTVDSED